jgi:Uma2 family endonuclease
MSEPLPKPWTVDDFLAWERQQPERYEFVGGVIRMMVGGSNAHTIIKGNVFAALRERLRGKPCRALSEGSKVVAASGTMYPDALVVCGPIDLAEDQVRQPAVVIEVLSRSTEDHDRGAKWVAYRGIEGLRHYVLIAQGQRRVEVYSRDGDDWRLRIVAPPEMVALPAVGLELGFDEIYEDSGV